MVEPKIDIVCGQDSFGIYRDGELLDAADTLMEAIEVLVPNVMFHEEYDQATFPTQLSELESG